MKHEVPDHPLKGLLSDIAGEYGLVLETVETFEAEYLFGDGVCFFGDRYDLVLVCFLVHFHLTRILIRGSEALVWILVPREVNY